MELIQLVIDYLDLKKIHYTEFRYKRKFLERLTEVTSSHDVSIVLEMYKNGTFLTFIEEISKIDKDVEKILEKYKKECPPSMLYYYLECLEISKRSPPQYYTGYFVEDKDCVSTFFNDAVLFTSEEIAKKVLNSLRSKYIVKSIMLNDLNSEKKQSPSLKNMIEAKKAIKMLKDELENSDD